MRPMQLVSQVCADTHRVMLWQIAHQMLTNPTADLLPEIDEIQKVSKLIAFKVAKAAMDAGVAPIISDEQLQHAIDKNFWQVVERVSSCINVSPSKLKMRLNKKGA